MFIFLYIIQTTCVRPLCALAVGTQDKDMKIHAKKMLRVYGKNSTFIQANIYLLTSYLAI